MRCSTPRPIHRQRPAHAGVHLGSMGESVKTIARKCRAHDAGRRVCLNDPYNGGTHLPDDSGHAGVQVRRGHRASLPRAATMPTLGYLPGPMPPFSKSLDDEGVDRQLQDVEAEHSAKPSSTPAHGTARHPLARNPDQNIADLKAHQIAANEGVAELARMVRGVRFEIVHAPTCAHVRDNARKVSVAS